MDQVAIGAYIARKRRELNLTQEQLAERLGISNKTVSKWENGRCMPDYGVVGRLCSELGITVGELMDGDDAEPDSLRGYDDDQVLDLLRRTQELEQQRDVLRGVLLIVLGIALDALSFGIGGSDVRDFVSGALLGISVGTILAGVVLTVRSMVRR